MRPLYDEWSEIPYNDDYFLNPRNYVVPPLKRFSYYFEQLEQGKKISLDDLQEHSRLEHEGRILTPPTPEEQIALHEASIANLRAAHGIPDKTKESGEADLTRMIDSLKEEKK